SLTRRSTGRGFALPGRIRLPTSGKHGGLLKTVQSRRPAEWLLATACFGAGAIMFLDSPGAGLFGVLAGVLLALDVLSRRASFALALPAIVAIGISSVLGTDQRNLVV